MKHLLIYINISNTCESLNISMMKWLKIFKNAVNTDFLETIFNESLKLIFMEIFLFKSMDIIIRESNEILYIENSKRPQ